MAGIAEAAQGMIAGRLGAKTDLLELTTADVGWLDANSPMDCYRPLWDAQRAGLVRLQASARYAVGGDIELSAQEYVKANDIFGDVVRLQATSLEACQ
jgi:hypothetical protein